jgi:hypothetical protein
MMRLATGRSVLETASTKTTVKQKLHFEMPVTKLSAGEDGLVQAQSLHADWFASLSVMKSRTSKCMLLPERSVAPRLIYVRM